MLPNWPKKRKLVVDDFDMIDKAWVEGYNKALEECEEALAAGKGDDEVFNQLREANEFLKEELKEFGTCDHEVNYCACPLIRLIEKNEEVLAKLPAQEHKDVQPNNWNELNTALDKFGEKLDDGEHKDGQLDEEDIIAVLDTFQSSDLATHSGTREIAKAICAKLTSPTPKGACTCNKGRAMTVKVTLSCPRCGGTVKEELRDFKDAPEPIIPHVLSMYKKIDEIVKEPIGVPHTPIHQCHKCGKVSTDEICKECFDREHRRRSREES